MRKSIFYIVLFILVIGAGAGAFFFVKKQKKYTDDYENEADDNIDKKKLSYDRQTYIALAKRLYRDVKGWGTDEQDVVKVIKKMQTADDWNALVLAYATNTEEADFDTLVDRLYYELEDNPGELEQVRNHLSSIGVTF